MILCVPPIFITVNQINLGAFQNVDLFFNCQTNYTYMHNVLFPQLGFFINLGLKNGNVGYYLNYQQELLYFEVSKHYHLENS